MAIDMSVGLTEIETSSFAVTVKVAMSFIAPCAAVIVVDPSKIPLARPLAFIVAMLPFEEVQVTAAVISAVVESVYVPVAVYCKVLPFATDPFIGVTAIETSSFTVTVILVVSEIAPLAAVILVPPMETALASPLAFIVAMASFVEDHVTEPVISSVD